MFGLVMLNHLIEKAKEEKILCHEYTLTEGRAVVRYLRTPEPPSSGTDSFHNISVQSAQRCLGSFNSIQTSCSKLDNNRRAIKTRSIIILLQFLHRHRTHTSWWY